MSSHENAMYRQLDPDRLLGAVESTGIRCDGRILALNSYENRVYQLGTEDGSFVVVKFYRNGRWSDASILEDHQFTLSLAAREIPVIAPMLINGTTLHRHDTFRFAVFPRRGGRWPEMDDLGTQIRVGRLLGRLHALGRTQDFIHRPRVDVATASSAAKFLLDEEFIPGDMRKRYAQEVQHLVERLENCFHNTGQSRFIRLHGDCHPGNILWTEESLFLVDFDDCHSGPAVQDFWMLLSGDRQQMTRQLMGILEGYRQFADFDLQELRLIEPLRTLRLLNFAAWLAQRWSDPVFPKTFPWFNTRQYWEEHLQMLVEQAATLEQPPLSLNGPW